MAAALSPRQTEILHLIALGRTNARIGVRLGVTRHTVKTHVRRLLTTMGAHNRAHAVFLGCQYGLIPLDVPDSEPDSQQRGA